MKPIFAPIILLALLAAPLLGSHYFSLDSDPSRLVLSVIALLLATFLALSLVFRLRNALLRFLAGSLLFGIIAFYQIARLLSYFFQGESFNRRFFFHFNLSSLQEAGGAYGALLAAALVYFLVLMSATWLLLRRPQLLSSYRAKPAILFLLLVGVVITDPDLAGYFKENLVTIAEGESDLSDETIEWEALGLDRSALQPEAAPSLPGKNLVFIYLESLENLYLDEKIYPELTPELNRLAGQGLRFTEMEQVPGADWTVGGIVASQCGVPLLFDMASGGNDVLQNGFLNQSICLGDILHGAGYRQVFLGGASTRFAGKGTFLRGHGYDEALGKEELASRLPDSSYLTGWGLYDDSLLEIAKKRFVELAEAGKPFNLTLLTIDTHHPTGNPSASCEPYPLINNSMFAAVHCSDHLVADFIQSISRHPAWVNTVVVLLSDHLAMRNVAFNHYPENYPRKLFFAVLNSEARGEINRIGTHMDVAPTVLDLLNVRHHYRFVAGSSLMDEDQSRIQTSVLRSEKRRQTLEYINAELLSSPPAGLCATPRPLSFEEGRLLLAGREVQLTIEGNPIDPSLIGKDYGFLATLTESGAPSSFFTFNLVNLKFVRYAFQDTPYFAILPESALSLDSHPPGSSTEDIVALLGNLQHEALPMVSAGSLAALTIDTETCRDALDRALQAENAERYRLEEICEDPEATLNLYDNGTGTLTLQEIAYGDTLFRAELVRNDGGIFELKEVRPVGSLSRNIQKVGCQAYFNKGDLIIPALRQGKDRYIAMRMHLLSDTDRTFELLEESDLRPTPAPTGH